MVDTNREVRYGADNDVSHGPGPAIEIDRARSAARIEHDIATLAGPEYTLSETAICRYAYTPPYQRALGYFAAALQELGFTVDFDPLGTLVARNRPPGELVFGVGSHCDSNRAGGRYDGTLGVVSALELCRLDAELGLGLPLQLVSFLEEEGSGFGQVLLGSRIVAQRISAEEIAQVVAIDDGRSLFEHAREAGHDPERWRDAIHVLDDLSGWIEMHIEQGRVLQDTQHRLGVVTAIAGYVHGDVTIGGRADHAGATPMDLRVDAAVIAAEVTLELERLATAAGHGTVGTVGELDLEPGSINVVPGAARVSLDIRGVNDPAVTGVANDIAAFAAAAAARRGGSAHFEPRQTMPATPMDATIVAALRDAAKASGEPYLELPSGAAHDTMCVADHRPTAMVFVPCKDGISHSPLEHASGDDAALAVEVMLNAVSRLTASAGARPSSG